MSVATCGRTAGEEADGPRGGTRHLARAQGGPALPAACRCLPLSWDALPLDPVRETTPPPPQSPPRRRQKWRRRPVALVSKWHPVHARRSHGHQRAVCGPPPALPW